MNQELVGREKEIPVELDELEKAIIGLGEEVGKLLSDIVPIRSITDQVVDDDECMAIKPLCDHAERLRSMRFDITAICERVRDTLKQLEL